MKLTIGAATDSGRRPKNEDSYKIVDVHHLGMQAEALLIVADGMGGKNFGEEASKTAVDAVTSQLQDKLSGGSLTGNEPVQALNAALREANNVVYALSQRDEESDGMGTTCVIALIVNSRLYVGHAGDSRAYVIHRGRLEQVTDDHSYVAEQVRAGLITEDGARKSKFRNVITRAVGIEPTIEPEVADFPIEGIDAILLCTDGLTNMVQDPEIERVLLTSMTAQACGDRLVRMAKSRGGSDNITAVTALFGDGPIVDESSLEQADGDQENAGVADAKPVQSGGVRNVAFMSLLVLALLLACSTVYLGMNMARAGYAWRAVPPFIVKPLPPAPSQRSPVKDLSRVTYKAPVTLCPLAVSPEPILFSQGNKSLIVRDLDGGIIGLGNDGTILYQYPWSHLVTSVTGSDSSDGLIASPANWHFATDPQGDARAHTIAKYRSTGEFVGVIKAVRNSNPEQDDLCPACGEGLRDPEALAVDGDGNIYVVDGTTLKFLKAQRMKTLP
jgi:PPM family protein phosphatase